MNTVINSCGPNHEFYFENNNKKCYIRPRGNTKQDSLDQNTSPKKMERPSLYHVARARTMIWSDNSYCKLECFEQVKDLFKPHGVILCFFISNSWLLFFKTTTAFREFNENLSQIIEMYHGKFISLNDFETEDVQLRNYSSYLKVLKNFYQKSP